MVDEKSIVPAGKIENRILLIRGEKVIIDADLAEFYGVATKRLNEQVKRNVNRFPADFMFQLTKEEKSEVVANCDHLKNLKYSKTLPYAFTEHGAIMAASVLNMQRAIEVSVFIVRAFVKFRQFITGPVAGVDAPIVTKIAGGHAFRFRKADGNCLSPWRPGHGAEHAAHDACF
jgi:hypothetical protein